MYDDVSINAEALYYSKAKKKKLQLCYTKSFHENKNGKKKKISAFLEHLRLLFLM